MDDLKKPRRELIRNAMQTPDGTILQSYHRHDYVTHIDEVTGLTYMLDGGLEYIRSSLNGDEVFMDMYDCEPHEVKRVVCVWGTYGKSGENPLKYVPVSEMSDNHLEAVLLNCPATRPSIKKVMQDEIEYRKTLK